MHHSLLSGEGESDRVQALSRRFFGALRSDQGLIPIRLATDTLRFRPLRLTPTPSALAFLAAIGVLGKGRCYSGFQNQDNGAVRRRFFLL
jgi:hypothetical protein